MDATILIVDDEKNTRDALRAALEDRYDVYTAPDVAHAMAIVESENVDLVLTDLRMAGEDGLHLIKRLRSLPHHPVCLLMTAYGSLETAVEAMRAGASDYLTKPMNLDEVEHKVALHLRARRLEAENRELRDLTDRRQDKGGPLDDIVGRSSVMAEIMETVKQVAPSRATVLIQGESGTGKELIARAVHRLSPRARGPLVTVHCAALSPQLLESELFGHERGAFTGAVERRIGRFEAADGGTIFLDEIGEIDAATQVKILRVLGERTFERVGSTKTLRVDVRLVAATNKDLRQLVEQGKFRDDLYFRLNVVTLQIPPLRERKGDIPLLVARFLAESNRENGKAISGFTPEAMQQMLLYHWPGNVRELRAVVEHAVVLARGTEAALRDLPASVREPGVVPGSAPGVPSLLNWENAEKQLILRALDRTRGNRSDAAVELGMSRRTLHRKLKAFGFESRRKRKHSG
jgi:DNA-binding NtrC family response regulator